MYQYVNLFGKEISTVIVMYALGGLLSFINFVLKRERYNYSKLRAIFYALFFISIGMVELKAMGLIRSGVMSLISGGEYVPDTSARIYGVVLFQPVMAYLISLFTGDKFRKVIDSFAAETYLYFAFGKLGCFLKGCCHGFPYENGVHSIVYGGKVFPVQLCEAISAALVVAVIVYIARDKVKLRTGSVFPIGTILYSVGRFIWEYFRYYNVHWEKGVLLGMNFWQLCCIFSIVVSIIWLIVLYKSPKYVTCSFEAKSEAAGTKIETAYYVHKEAKEKEKRQEKKKEKNIQHKKKKK